AYQVSGTEVSRPAARVAVLDAHSSINALDLGRDRVAALRRSGAIEAPAQTLMETKRQSRGVVVCMQHDPRGTRHRIRCDDGDSQVERLADRDRVAVGEARAEEQGRARENGRSVEAAEQGKAIAE